MIRFIREKDKDYTGIEITLSSDADISENFEAFRSFLLACGFSIGDDEHIGFIED
jgi:hypothetical protein